MGEDRLVRRAVAVAIAVLIGVFVGPMAAGDPAGAVPSKSHPVAPAGKGPVARALPATSLPYHGFRKGQRAPVEPPALRASGGRRPAAPHRRADGPTGPQATNVRLLPGLAVGDTSLEAFFDAPDTGWTNGTIALSTAADPATVLHSAPFSFALLTPCRTLATYCWTLRNSQDWALVAGTSYVVTVTLTATDGSQQTSDPSAPATPRILPVPPPLPPQQTRGTGAGSSSGRTGATPTLRGFGVNTATGALTRTAVDASMSSSYRINVSAARTYSSSDSSTGLLGVGWNFSYDARVTAQQGSDAVVFRAEDGTESTYTKQADGSYTAPPGVQSTLSVPSGGGWRVVTPDQRRLTFDGTGRLLSVQDERGKGVTLSYDADGTLTGATDAGGRRLATTVESGHLVTLTLPDGRTVHYTYTGDRLATVRDPDGDVTTYGYDSAGRLSTITDALGHRQLTTAYDAASGRVTSQTDNLGNVTRFSWDPATQESTTIDPDGVVTYDGYRANVLEYTQNSNNDTVVYRYDSQLNKQVLVDPLGHQYDLVHDAHGNATAQTVLGANPATEKNIDGVVEKASYDAANNLLSATDGRGKTVSFTYNEFNQVTSSVDADNQTTTYAYDSTTGLTTTSTDPLGGITRYAYDAPGDKVAQTDPVGLETTYTYDQTGRVVSTVDPRGNVAGADPAKYTTTNRYDGEDRIRQTTDPLGHVNKWDYDLAGRLVTYTDANTFATTYTYNTANQVTQVIDPDLRTHAYRYTPGGRLAAVTDGAGDTTSYTYDAAGRKRTETSPRGNANGANPADFTTTYTYNPDGDVTSVSHPYPGGGTQTTTTAYDSLDRPVAVTDPLGRTTTSTYDETGDRVSATDPLGDTRSWTYDGNGRVLTATDPRGGVTRYRYDADGRLVAQTTPAGEQTTKGYDADGRLTSITSPLGNVAGAIPATYTTRYGYDAAGNQTSVTDPLGHVSRTGYDAADNVTSRTDANGHTTTYIYDAGNRLTTIKAPDASNAIRVTTDAYDHDGNLIQRVDPLGFHNDYHYDAAGRLDRTTDALGRQRQYGYDPDGDIVQILTGRATTSSDPAARAANTITQHYDIVGRPVDRILGSGAIYSYGYDAADELTGLADPTGTQTRGYDSAGRLVSVTGEGGGFGYGYDRNGNVTSRTLPDGSGQSLGYDADNRTTSLSTPAGSASYGYDADSELVRTTLPGGSAVARGYDPAGRLTTLTDQDPGGQTLAGYTVTRDPVGNPVRLDTTQNGAQHSDAFTFDPANRVTAICYGTTTCTGATQALKFSYDLTGNRLTQTRVGTGAYTQRYSYDAAGELSFATGGPAGTVNFSYDADGNQVRAGNVTTGYDLDNAVTTVDDGSRRTAYTQDAAGDRIGSDTTPDAGGATTHTAYSWDDNSSLPTLSLEQTGVQAARVYADNPDGSPLSLTVAGSVDVYQPDPFGNTAELVSAAGAIQRQYTMTDPFGGFTESTPGGAGAAATRLGFAGQLQDPTTGDYHLRARDYSNTLGRFRSVDPVPPVPTDPATSAYVYAGDNPLTGSDPSGKMAAGDCATYTCYQEIMQASAQRTADRAEACATQTCHDEIMASDCHCTDDSGTAPPPRPSVPVLTITADTKARGGTTVAQLLQNSHSPDDMWIINGHLYTRDQLLDQVQGLGGRYQDPQLCEAGGCMLSPSLFPNGGHPCGYSPSQAWCNFAQTTGTEVGYLGLADGAGGGRPGDEPADSGAAGDGSGGSTVWDSITPTQDVYPGTVVPKSFVLDSGGGVKVWVHPNATEHIVERQSSSVTGPAARMSVQAQLTSLRSAVFEATHEGVPLNQMLNIDGWELKFSMRPTDQYPALVHALYTG